MEGAGRPPRDVGEGDTASLRAFLEARFPERLKDNLPIRLTSFIGREQEVEEAKELLRDDSRLLTLTGSGGCGKTSLALRVAETLVGKYPEGVWLVELAALSDPSATAAQVVSALGLREETGRSRVETLSKYLKSRKLLLVLDNCEHLVEACAGLSEALLRCCPGLQILATSREALCIDGETVRQVPSLSLPENRLRPVPGELDRYEAVRLFAERARAASATFELTEANAAAIAEVCRRLDGIPLAIELAAARTRVFPVEQIVTRLDEGFRVLTAGSRTAVSRHRTLEAAIGWSYALLSEEERIMLRRLAVFQGVFTLGAAEAVCAGEGIEKNEVFELVSRLVDKSLVVGPGGEARYQLLETIRRYGWDRLDESGEEAEFRRRHADFFLALAEEAEPELNGPDRYVWLDRLDAERDNLRAALRWARENGEIETGLRIAGALGWFWTHQGYWSEGRSWIEEALAQVGEPTPTVAEAEAIYVAGALAWMQGDHAAAYPRLQESVELWRELGDERGLSAALITLSFEVLAHGDIERAHALAAESVSFWEEGLDGFERARTLAALGIVTMAEGNHAAACSHLEESARFCREIGDDWLLAQPLRSLGVMALRQGEHDRAEALLKESIHTLRGLNDKGLLSISLQFLATTAAVQGRYERGSCLFGVDEALRESIGHSVFPYYRADYDRGVACARAGLDEETFVAAWAEGKAMTPEVSVVYALEVSRQTHEEREGNPSTVEIIERLKERVSEAEAIIEHMRLLAATDDLTGLHNRRHLELLLEEDLNRSRRYGAPLSIILFDLDDFKAVNDAFGHDVGDSVLAGLARAVESLLRQSDRFGRWGGEEFLVVVPEATEEAARLLAERLRARIETQDFGMSVGASASFGVAEFRQDDNKTELIKRADMALYRAKASGKNRVELETASKAYRAVFKGY